MVIGEQKERQGALDAASLQFLLQNSPKSCILYFIYRYKNKAANFKGRVSMDRDITDKANEIFAKYRKRIDKRIAGKPQVLQILIERTCHSATAILALIDGISFEKLTFDMYYICNDIEFKRYVRLFDSQLELAGIDPDKFIFGLHKFYNDIARELKKENKYYEFAQFMGAVMQLQFEKKEKLNKNIVDAYVSLILQTLEYLRKDKFNLDTFPYGVSTDGEILEGPYPLAYSDLPVMEYEKILRSGKKIGGTIEHFRLLQKLYAKYNITINEPADIDVVQGTQIIHCNTATAMFPFINEFTFDMATTTAFDATIIPFHNMVCMVGDIEPLKEKLKHRNRTLPSNGVKFEITDLTGELQGLLLKEMLYNGSVHMLYKIYMYGTSLSGYYNTATGFLYSVTKDANIPEPYKKLSAFVLTLYASQVLDSIRMEDVSSQFMQGKSFLKIEAFSKAGKIQDVYHSKELQPGSGVRKGSDLYSKEERQINVIIRNLPEGRQASNEAKALAAQYGYELGPNQTFVRPFIKEVFVRNNKKQPSSIGTE